MTPYTSIRHLRECPAKIGKPGQCICDPTVRRFKVRVYDFGGVDVIAKTASSAKYHIYLALLDVGYVKSFKDFISFYTPSVSLMNWDAPYEVIKP